MEQKCETNKNYKTLQTVVDRRVSRFLNNYRMSRSLDNWKKFKKVVKNTKRSFFNMKIQEVANKSCGP